MTWMVDTSWSLSVATWDQQDEPEWSGHSGKSRTRQGLTWAHQHRLPHPKANLGTVPSPCPACQQQRPMLSPHVALLLPGAGQLPQALSILEKFIFTGMEVSFEFFFPDQRASVSTTAQELTEGLIQRHGFRTA